MAVSVHRKKPRPIERFQANESSFFYSVVPKIFFRIPTAIFILIFIYFWSSSTTILSGNVVHLCVSSRKLNNLYCLSAGTTQPDFRVPVDSLAINATSISKTITGTTDEEGVKLASDSDSKISTINNCELQVIDLDTKSSVSFDGTRPGYRIPIDPVVINGTSISKTNNGTDEEGVKLVSDSASTISTIKNGEDGTNSELQVIHFDTKNSVSFDRTEKVWNATLEYAFRDVEAQMRMQRSWISNSNQATSCEGRGIYVYELPSKFNKDLIAQCNEMIPWVDFCKFFSNEALGEPIQNLGNGWYNTHQYSLEPILHAKILKHPCRVYNQNEGKLFYVPYYGGLDVLRWHFKNVSYDVKDSLALEVVRWLESQTSWYKNLGKDHVFVLGKITWDFRRNDESLWGTRLLELDEMQNPIKLLIERQPWNVNEVGIPHPTFFHPQTDEDIIKWQLKIMKSNRRNLVSFAGAPRPDSPESIRSVLIDQCVSMKNEECKFLNCTAGECDQPESIIKLFSETEFCLQPPGDSPTRKSVFDSLVSGCIPVMFDPFTAYYEYPWHLPEDREKYSVFVEKEKVRKDGVNVVERLMNIPGKERENMRRYIVYELLPGLVYGDADAKFEKFQDAFSITVNNLLERVNRLHEL